MRGLLIFTSLLASVAALRAPARVPPTGRAVVGRRFVLSAALLAPSAATAASLSSQLAGATGLAAQLEAGQKAPKAATAYMGNEADARFADIIAADLVRVRNTSVQHRCHCGPSSAYPRPNPHPHPNQVCRGRRCGPHRKGEEVWLCFGSGGQGYFRAHTQEQVLRPPGSLLGLGAAGWAVRGIEWL